ncbi:hypothetical protein ACFFQW_02735 [Umezawaea endophytica]|uniref:Anti-sigma regulatory factor (Ser/Thr protein kinase) n=1 Tax=Umezawaea endophytica TaxID=1654476 RepID=A0A9X2VSE6_9PSEU|nr:hypothetical protein [Umezawaea endophytica]MCS7482013.1 hypothetical protein [Umezawaea endophytica]
MRLPEGRPVGSRSPWELRIADQDTARAVRRAVREFCRPSVFGGLLDDLLLVVSELVANTYAHTEGPRVLRLSFVRGGVLVEVGQADSAPALLCSPLPCPSRACALLDGLSSGWGVLPDPDGGASAWALVTRSGRR